MDWELFIILMSAWVIFLAFAIVFFQWQKMNDKKYEEQYLKDKNGDVEIFEYRKHLNDYIIRVHDKNNIEDFHSLGNVKYTSEILNIIGIECTQQVARLLNDHTNVISVHEAPEGDFCLDDIVREDGERVVSI